MKFNSRRKKLSELLRSGDLGVLIANYGHAYFCISEVCSTAWSHTVETTLLHMMTTYAFSLQDHPTVLLTGWETDSTEGSQSRELRIERSPFLFSPIPSLFKSSTAQRVLSIVLIGVMLADQTEREGLQMSSLLSLAHWRTLVSSATDKYKLLLWKRS